MKNIKSVFTKAVCLILCGVMIFCVSSIFSGCNDNNIYDGELLRLHIRANSNSDVDQAVKLKVRDSVNRYIADNVDKTTFDEAYDAISECLSDLSALATSVLKSNGFSYGAKASLRNEYFPTRVYGDVTVTEGFYDALIIELGDGAGDNWWCVIYPPLCYGDKFEYKSFFAELFK